MNNFEETAKLHRKKDTIKVKILDPNIFNKDIKVNLLDLNINNQIIQVCPMVTSAYVKIKVPDNIVNNLNTYLDKLYKDPFSTSRDDSLVGQIKMKNGKKGKQLMMDMDDELVKPFSIFVSLCSKAYVNNLLNLNINDSISTDIILDEIWSVHQYETDYNPIHQHNNSITDVGLSSFLHIKLPEQLLEKNKTNLTQKKAGGWFDGRTVLNWGDISYLDTRQLKFIQSTHSLGEVGVLYLFPQWLRHGVYPFFGDGERRTVAANLGIKFNS